MFLGALSGRQYGYTTEDTEKHRDLGGFCKRPLNCRIYMIRWMNRIFSDLFILTILLILWQNAPDHFDA